mgnify:FL=1|jgi:hypothetical protein|nr:MAG TPA: GTPase subunit of restriction endonuclease [Caudoviricetes sp.]
MPEYQFADKGGKIVSVEYDKNNYFSAEQVLASLDSAFNRFPFPAYIEQVIDYDDVFHVTFPEGNDGIGDVFICAKGTTPGGRSGLKDEQRIQPKAKYLNYVYDRGEEGKKAIFLGVYNRDGETILCTWKVMASAAASIETPISKQIKITSIAKAMREGFVQQDKGKGEYVCAFRPEFLYFYLRNCDWLHTGHVSELAEHTMPENFGATEDTVADKGFEEVNFYTGIKCKYPRNRIVFGAPGTGKSFRLKDDCRALLANTTGGYERVTFHPDYTFSQFVGAYKPVTDDEGNIRYDFVPGPFMRVYVKAIKSGRTDNPQPFILVVEEINRAKVAAVFGDVFQLLDRDALGVSEYEIEVAEDIKKYLAAELGGDPDNYCQIRIPDNMFIWASMNSADQGVFPMDTAFKRRWSFEYLGINENESKIRGSIMLGEDDIQVVEWNILRKAINEKLASEYRVNEDKLMGPFFLPKTIITTVSDTDDTIADTDLFLDTFKSRVIMYLYEDAAKQHKHKLFAGCPDTTKYSAVCEAFDKIGMRIFGEDFEERYYNPQKG